jgi:hypothetical protein
LLLFQDQPIQYTRKHESEESNIHAPCEDDVCDVVSTVHYYCYLTRDVPIASITLLTSHNSTTIEKEKA